MTKEEAIKGLKENLCSLCAYGSQNMDSCDIRECDNRDYIKALEQQPSEDCVSRAEVLKAISEDLEIKIEGRTGLEIYQNEVAEIIKTLITNQETKVKALPPVTSTHGICMDCKWWDSENNKIGYCNACKHGHWSSTWDIGIYRKTKADFYCADFEKRGASG